MANRRCLQTLTRCLQSITTLPPLSQALAPHALNQTLTATPPHYIFVNNFHACQRATVLTRSFSSKPTDTDDGDDDDDDDEEYDESEEDEEENENERESVVLSAEDKEKEATEIGYKVIGPLQKSDQVFKSYEPVFAVVQVMCLWLFWFSNSLVWSIERLTEVYIVPFIISVFMWIV